MALSRDDIFKLIEDAEDQYDHDPEMNIEQKHWILAGMIEEKMSAPANIQQQVQADSPMSLDVAGDE